MLYKRYFPWAARGGWRAGAPEWLQSTRRLLFLDAQKLRQLDDLEVTESGAGENRHGYRYTYIYTYICTYIYCMCKLLLSCSHPAEVQGVESRKPKANNEQERLNGGQQKLTSWRWELATGKWVGRGGHHSPSTVATAFATWLLHFTQFGASSAKFLQSVLALTDVIKKHSKGRWKEFIPSLCYGGRCAWKKGMLLSCFVPNLWLWACCVCVWVRVCVCVWAQSQSICQSRASSKIPITNWQRAEQRHPRIIPGLSRLVTVAAPAPVTGPTCLTTAHSAAMLTTWAPLTSRQQPGGRQAILEWPAQAIMAFKCRVTYQFTWLLVTSHNLPTVRTPPTVQCPVLCLASLRVCQYRSLSVQSSHPVAQSIDMLTWPPLALWPDAQNRDELLLSCSSHSAPSGYGFVLNWQRRPESQPPTHPHPPSTIKPLMAAKAVCALFVLGPSTMTPLPPPNPLPASTPSFPFSFSTLHLSKKVPTPSPNSWLSLRKACHHSRRCGAEIRQRGAHQQLSSAAHVRNNLLYLAFSLLLCTFSSRRSKQSYPATRAEQVLLRESFGCTRCVRKESNMFHGSLQQAAASSAGTMEGADCALSVGSE